MESRQGDFSRESVEDIPATGAWAQSAQRGGKLITDSSFSRMVRCSSSLLNNGWEFDWRQRRSKRIADLSKEREHA
jgi:hypothetical protein